MQRVSVISQSIYAVSKNKYDNFGKVLYLNGLLLINVSFGMAATQIVPEIAEQMNYDSLGQVVVLFQYILSMIGNIFAPTYLKKLPYRWSFFILASSGAFQCMVGIFITGANKDSFGLGATYFGCLFISALVGLCYGGLWVAQNLYISENSNDKNKALYFGVANSLSNSAALIGSLTSIYVLNFFKKYKNGEFYYFIVLFLLSFSTQLLYLFVAQPPSKTKTDSNKKIDKEAELQPAPIPEDINESMSGSDTLIQRQEFVEDLVEQRKEAFIKEHKQDYEVIEFFNDLPIAQQLLLIWQVTKSKKIRNILPYMFATGLVLGFEYGVYYKLITQCIINTYPQYADNQTEQQIKTFVIFGCQGMMEIFGGIIIGFFGDWFTINFTSSIQSGLIHLVSFLTLTDCFLLNYNIAIAFGLLWGFSDCAGQANCMSLLSEDWGDDVRVFGLYNFMQNFGCITAILLSILMNNVKFYYYFLILFIWYIVSNFNMSKYRRYQRVKEYDFE